MKYLIVDVETTTIDNGHPFNPDNKLCLIGTRGYKNGTYVFNIEYDEEPYGHWLGDIQKQIDESDVLVFFNAKFDLHWLRRYNINFNNKKIWDCQVVEFIYSNQTLRMPSLDEVAELRGLGKKLDEVKLNYWDKGIDTPDVPYHILSDYLIQDLLLTEKLFKQQLDDKRFNDKSALINLENADLLVLQEMEWNGCLYDVKKSLEESAKLSGPIRDITARLNDLAGSNVINWNSTDHVSAVLYGGVVEEPIKIPDGFFKSGKKKGEPKFKNGVKEHEFPRLVEPIQGSELEKPGYWSTSEGVLRSLPLEGRAKEIVDLLLELGKLDKLDSTYLRGLPALIEKKNWKGNYIHGQLNKCVAVTGRLSSSGPNLQNMPEVVFNMIVSRFE